MSTFRPEDSTGRPIKVGDTVSFRGRLYTIKRFRPGEGRFGTAAIVFDEPQHTGEVADEISVDLVDGHPSPGPDPQTAHN